MDSFLKFVGMVLIVVVILFAMKIYNTPVQTKVTEPVSTS